MKHSNSLKNRKYAILFSLFISVFSFSQSKRFFYDAVFKIDTLGTVKRDIVVLELNKNDNMFFSNEYLVTDSINKINKDNTVFAYPKFTEVVKFNKKNDDFIFIKNLSMNYYEFNYQIKLNWNLTGEKKEMGNYNVEKATAKYGGRNWIAWFCADLPFPYGPYVFNGLPGLILDIYDDQNIFKFSFIQNKNFPDDLNSYKIFESLFSDRKIKIKREDWKKILISFYQNPIPEYKSGNAVMMKDSGKEYTAEDYRGLEKQIQNQIRKFNNPIELDNKINYK